jgi:hypothetical protein
MIEDLVKAPLPILKIDGGLAEILYLLLFLAVLALLVLEFLLEEGVFGQGLLELHLQPLHRNGMTLSLPLESGLQLGSICMAEAIIAWSAIAKVLNLPKVKKITAIRELLVKIHHEQTLVCQLLLLQANDLDQVLHNFLVILLKHCHMLVTLRALCQKNPP